MDSNGGSKNGGSNKSHRPLNQEELTAVFRKLGARDPESWAGSQIREGINQLARFIFLRKAWSLIVKEGDASWIDVNIKYSEAKPQEPYAGVGLALKTLRSLGVGDHEITDIVRGMQAELLFGFCSMLDEEGDPELDHLGVQWWLVQMDADGRPLDIIGSLHESVLEMDPTGREMRPRRDAGPRGE
jgi:hypothetical protein